MSKKLAGTLFCFQGNKFDYCFIEAIQCLLEFCDHVIVGAGGDDNTYEDILKSFNNPKLDVIRIPQEIWDEQKGKYKLSYFTNRCIDIAADRGYEYQFNLQADEILHEKSYLYIRTIIEGGCESYMCKRINLWASPYKQLNVPLSRMPCSFEIVRLAKTKYRSWDDAENIKCDEVNQSYTNLIRIYHMGFVRKQEVMKSKIINMQENVFGIDHDPKLDRSEIFHPEFWFDPKTDLKPISEPLPLIIQQWAKERIYE